MTYWTVQKRLNGKLVYVGSSDEAGYPIHVENESEAYKFRSFQVAMSFFNLGYIIKKHYI